MATETDLRDLFRDPGEQGGSDIDVDAVIRRSRSARRPRVAVAATFGVLAVAAGLTPTVLFSQPQESAIVASEDAAAGSAESDPSGEGAEATGMPSAASLYQCGAEVPEVPATSDLIVEVQFVEVVAGATVIPVTVTLTNLGTTAVAGAVWSQPVVAMSRDGVIVWHSTPSVPAVGADVGLAPGQSRTFDVALQPVVCLPGDTGDGFATDLPAAPPGRYQVRAALDLALDAGGVVLVTGPAAQLVLS